MVVSRVNMLTTEFSVLAKTEPVSWSTPATLVRALEPDGTEFFTQATAAAHEILKTLIKGRNYSARFSWTTIKPNKVGAENGFQAPLDVILKYKLPVAPVVKTWPKLLTYSFMTLDQLEQLQVGTWLDVKVWAHSTGGFDSSGVLGTQMLELEENGTFV